MDRAEAGFRRALALDLSSVPARFGLASLLLDNGAVQEATAVAAHMAADRPETLWLRARLAYARGDAGGARDALTRLLRKPRLNPEQQAEALLLLGLALGDLGDSREGFAMARQGKQIQRELYASQAAGREGEVAKLERLASWLETVPADLEFPCPAIPGAAETHVFLLGFPRSGTTLLEQMLAAHPRVSTLEEAPTLATAYQAFLSSPDACAALTTLDAEEAAAWADHYWSGIRGRGIDIAGRVFVDKQPAGTLFLPIIARLFPGARILFALRDPRDVALSCFRQAFQMNAMTYAFTDLAETAACYDACMRLAEAGARAPAARLGGRAPRGFGRGFRHGARPHPRLPRARTRPSHGRLRAGGPCAHHPHSERPAGPRRAQPARPRPLAALSRTNSRPCCRCWRRGWSASAMRPRTSPGRRRRPACRWNRSPAAGPW